MASQNPPGQELTGEPVIDEMKRRGIPLTRANYVELAFDSEEVIEAEREASIPYELLTDEPNPPESEA